LKELFASFVFIDRSKLVAPEEEVKHENYSPVLHQIQTYFLQFEAINFHYSEKSEKILIRFTSLITLNYCLFSPIIINFQIFLKLINNLHFRLE